MKKKVNKAQGHRLKLLLAFVFVCVAGLVLVVVQKLGPVDALMGLFPSFQQGTQEYKKVDIKPKAFDEYSWDELSHIAAEIAHAPQIGEARIIAARYQLMDNTGHLVDKTRELKLKNGDVLQVRLVGLLHDELEDGTKTGLSFMAIGLPNLAMNDTATNTGGWKDSKLRAWLNGELLSYLPDDVRSQIKLVKKLTNNVGVTTDRGAVSETLDQIWLFSAHEVADASTWFTREFGSSPTASIGWEDFRLHDKLLQEEGKQYLYFKDHDVTESSDAQHVLKLTDGVGWWYRTPYSYSFTKSDEHFFYQVMASGYPSSVGSSEIPAGVVVGFCL